jgi:hypothetical protein
MEAGRMTLVIPCPVYKTSAQNNLCNVKVQHLHNTAQFANNSGWTSSSWLQSGCLQVTVKISK